MTKPLALQGVSVERVTRIELALSAWEADVLPLNYTRVLCGSKVYWARRASSLPSESSDSNIRWASE